MGVLPLQFAPGEDAASLGLTGEETYSVGGLAGADEVPRTVTVTAAGPGGTREFTATVRIDTPAEAAYYRHGGILPYVLRDLRCPLSPLAPSDPPCAAARQRWSERTRFPRTSRGDPDGSHDFRMLRSFGQLESATPGHSEYGHANEAEITTGPLGQGLADAVGTGAGQADPAMPG